MATSSHLDTSRGAFKTSSDGFKLRGVSRQVALFVSVLSLIGAGLAAGIDLADPYRWDPLTLQTWTLGLQALVVLGLIVLARLWRSTSFLVLAVIIALVVLEEAFHVLNPVSEWLAKFVEIENSWSTVRLRVLNGVLIYGFVAVLGVSLLVVSLTLGSPGERHVVRNVAIMLFIAGAFAGPVSIVTYWLPQVRDWILVEESGETLVFVVMIGYIAGLLTLVRTQVRVSSSPRLFRRR